MQAAATTAVAVAVAGEEMAGCRRRQWLWSSISADQSQPSTPLHAIISYQVTTLGLLLLGRSGGGRGVLSLTHHSGLRRKQSGKWNSNPTFISTKRRAGERAVFGGGIVLDSLHSFSLAIRCSTSTSPAEQPHPAVPLPPTALI